MLALNWQKLLLEALATGGLGGGMAGGAVSGSGSVLDEEAYELEDGSSWGANSPLLKSKKTQGEEKMRKFDEFRGSEFGPWEYQAKGLEASFYYVGEWGRNLITKLNGNKKGEQGKDEKEKFIKNSESDPLSRCALNEGRKISGNCGGYGARKLPLKLDDEIDFDGGKKLEEMINYVSKDNAKGLENMWKDRTIELEEELFGIFKGRDFGIEKLGTGNDKRINLEVKNLEELISFLESGQEILKKEGESGEIVEGGSMKLVQGKTKTLWKLIKKYITSQTGKGNKNREKDGMLMQAGANFLRGIEGDVGYVCRPKSEERDEKLKKYYGECVGKLKTENVEVTRVLKTIYVQKSGKMYIPKVGGGASWDEQEPAFKKKEFEFWSGQGLGGDTHEPDSETLKNVLSETCAEDGKDVSLTGVFTNPEGKITAELCKEFVKPGFGDEVSNKRVCYFKFKNGKQNYLRRGNFFNGMLKIPVGYKDAEGYGAKCSVHGI